MLLLASTDIVHCQGSVEHSLLTARMLQTEPLKGGAFKIKCLVSCLQSAPNDRHDRTKCNEPEHIAKTESLLCMVFAALWLSNGRDMASRDQGSGDEY